MNDPTPNSITTPAAMSSAPSVFFVSLPKSGTVYTWYSLQDTTGLKLPEFHLLEGWNDYNTGRDFSCPDLYACGDYNTQLLIPAGMKNFLQGYIFGSHMQASYHNMRILKESGIDRITVLLRDPRDAFVSWVHHLNKLGPSARDYHSKIYHIPRNYYDWPLDEQFGYQIRTFLPVTVNWVEGWLDYYASADKEVEILFVYYDELKRKPERYIQRITEFHGLRDVDLSKIVKAEPGKMHFRKGEHEQWREEFPTGDQPLVENLMQDRILRGFNSAAEKHPGFVSANECLATGRIREALLESLAAITQFPNYLPAYEQFFQVAEKLDIDIAGLRKQVESELSSSSTSSAFIYRYELVDGCKKIAGTLS